MLRHQRHKHSDCLTITQAPQASVNNIRTSALNHPDGELPMKFVHPFCMTLSGPSQCGKTTVTYQLLRNNALLIDPPPKRIVWMYRRWQPMYDTMKNTIIPPIEFVKGIPVDIEQDHYLDTNIPNLLIMDDLMNVTSKDQRINDIFTVDSHHRNCSVITMNQNLYYNKDPTQRRNSHYLMLFNNPVDKQSIMTLGRQMYPSNSQYFVRHFEDAVSKPYGYLLLDLRTSTPEHLRLRANALDGLKFIRRHHPESIESEQLDTIQHFDEDKGQRSDFTAERLFSPCQHCGAVYFTDTDLDKHIICQHRKMYYCEHCGKVYDTISELRKHEAIHDIDCDSEMEDRPSKMEHFEHTDEQMEFWASIIRPQVLEELKGEMEPKEEQYRQEGFDDGVAYNMTINDMLPIIRKLSRKYFTKAIIAIRHLPEDKVYMKLTKTAETLQRNGGLDPDTAIREGVRIHKEPLGILFAQERDISDDSEDEQTDDSEEIDDEQRVDSEESS